MKLLLAATALTALFTSSAHAICSSPDGPEAEPVLNGGQAGTRPWIQVFNVKADEPLAMFTVDARCKRDQSSVEKFKTPCAAVKPIEIERVGGYMRPKAALPEGTHVQITTGKTLIADFVIKRAHKNAVTIDSVTAGKRASKPLQGCQLKGFEIPLTIKPPAGNKTQDYFQNTMLLVYAKQPDPANPLTNLAHVLPMVGGGEPGVAASVYLRDTSYEPKYVPAKFPAKIWVSLADDDEHATPPVEVTIK